VAFSRRIRAIPGEIVSPGMRVKFAALMKSYMLRHADIPAGATS
jgi:hypothetical protein